MNLLESFKMAFSNLRASKMRSFLTMLGIIIGVGAVIVIVGLGNGMKLYMTEQFESMGTNTLSIQIMGRGSGRTVSVDQMYEILDEHPDYLQDLSPTAYLQNPVKIDRETVSTTSVTGVSESYLQDIKDYALTQGRDLQYADILKRNKVCVIGSYLNKTYFGGQGLGKTLKLGGNPFTVVGILDEISDSTEGSSDDALYIPYSTASRLGNMGNLNSFTMTVTDVNQSVRAKEIVEDALYEIFEDENAYSVVSMAEMLDMMNTMVDVEITILAIIAGISLVVGGIGIMNIMLVSVSERTREIGIRKALGAKERYIMSQFVIEAATTSALGGALGIVLGELLSTAATALIPMLLGEELTVTPSVGSIIMAVGISVGIGVLFGYLPAKKAAQLNPIDALRYE